MKKKPLKNHPIIVRMASLKIGVTCLVALFVLTFLGTYYQVDYGLYAAQKKFFTSFFVLLGGFIPFPGAKLVLWIFFFNLLASTLRYPIRWEKMGVLFIHYGILFLLVSSFIIHYFAQESVIVLEEGQSTNVSQDYFASEIALIEYQKGGVLSNDSIRKVSSFDAVVFESTVDRPVVFKNGLSIKPIYYYPHSIPNDFKVDGVENASGFTSLIYQPPPVQREAISPGGLFEVVAPGWKTAKKILLWEGEINSFPIEVDGRVFFLKLQRKKYPLPFEIELIKFTKKDHMGTRVAKSFESDVWIRVLNRENGKVISREAKIFMNNPLRIDGYTLFQASYSIDRLNNKRSIFATVKNESYYVPYIASGLVGWGILFHFIFRFIKRSKKRKR